MLSTNVLFEGFYLSCSTAILLKAAGVSRADVVTFAAGADMVKEAV